MYTIIANLLWTLTTKDENTIRDFIDVPKNYNQLCNYYMCASKHRKIAKLSPEHTHSNYYFPGVISIKNKITELYAGNAEFHNENRKIPLIDLTVDEKTKVKSALVTVLLGENDNSIKGLLAECIKAVAEIDFPDRYGIL